MAAGRRSSGVYEVYLVFGYHLLFYGLEMATYRSGAGRRGPSRSKNALKGIIYEYICMLLCSVPGSTLLDSLHSTSKPNRKAKL